VKIPGSQCAHDCPAPPLPLSSSHPNSFSTSASSVDAGEEIGWLRDDLVILFLDVCWTFASMTEAKPASLWFPLGSSMTDLVVTLLAYFGYHVGWWKQY
jgi:hypothetical protein